MDPLTTGTPLLVAESIGKTFGNQRVLTSARLEAYPASITFVAGCNGAGKSTLLRIVAGQLSPDSGVVRFSESVYVRPSLYQLARRGLFFLPDREILSPPVTLRRQFSAISDRFDGGTVDEVADTFGISDLLGATPLELSGGELRRAEVCLAALRRPRCLIVDEPLRSIDPKDTEALLRQFVTMARQGCAVVVSGHATEELLGVADSVVWVTAGTSYSLGNPANARLNDHFRKEYLIGRWN